MLEKKGGVVWSVAMIVKTASLESSATSANIRYFAPFMGINYPRNEVAKAILRNFVERKE